MLWLVRPTYFILDFFKHLKWQTPGPIHPWQVFPHHPIDKEGKNHSRHHIDSVMDANYDQSCHHEDRCKKAKGNQIFGLPAQDDFR